MQPVISREPQLRACDESEHPIGIVGAAQWRPAHRQHERRRARPTRLPYLAREIVASNQEVRLRRPARGRRGAARTYRVEERESDAEGDRLEQLMANAQPHHREDDSLGHRTCEKGGSGRFGVFCSLFGESQSLSCGRNGASPFPHMSHPVSPTCQKCILLFTTCGKKGGSGKPATRSAARQWSAVAIAPPSSLADGGGGASGGGGGGGEGAAEEAIV